MGKSSKPKNTHKIFVDSPEEGTSNLSLKIYISWLWHSPHSVVNFNPAEYFDTHYKHDQTRKDGPQEKGERTDEKHNQVSTSVASRIPSLSWALVHLCSQRLKKKRKKRYKVMMDRVRRCRELQRVEQKMQTQKHLMVCGIASLHYTKTITHTCTYTTTDMHCRGLSMSYDFHAHTCQHCTGKQGLYHGVTRTTCTHWWWTFLNPYWHFWVWV